MVATVPRSAEQKEVRAIVLKYQKNSCIPGRCYKDAKVKKCKYGFPYDLLGKDGLDSSGIRYNYARFSEEDRTVVLYNKDLPGVWDGHVDVQRVTQLGLVLATSGSAAYLLGGQTVHRFFRLSSDVKT